jgi:hypothetical protein
MVGHRPVGLVADRAIFLDGRVLENKRSLVGGMALVAQVVDPLIRVEKSLHRPVHLMTATAAHEAFPHRVMRRVLHLYGDVLVALEAELGLGGFERRLNGRGGLMVTGQTFAGEASVILLLVLVDRVAIGTTEIHESVLTSLPMHGRTLLMARGAKSGGLAGGKLRKSPDVVRLGAFHVLASRPVTTLATGSFHPTLEIRQAAMYRIVLLVVTFGAGFRADVLSVVALAFGSECAFSQTRSCCR